MGKQQRKQCHCTPPKLTIRSHSYNIEFKGDFYANFGAVFLDCAKISFGERMVMGPGELQAGLQKLLRGGIRVLKWLSL